jgi:3-hydroxyacyl-CoA dehydrogenase
MPLVEVVGGDLTSSRSIEQAIEFYRSIGKVAIHLRKEVVGHIANRLQAAIFREALHLVHSGVASAADVDDAIAYGPGMRWALMGPLLTFHLAGGEGGIEHFLEHIGPALNTWIDDLGDERVDSETTPAVTRSVLEEAAGRSIAELAAQRDAFLVALLALPR